MLNVQSVDRVGRTVVSVAFLFLVNGIVLGAWATNIPAIKLKFDLSEAELGYLLLVMAAGAVITMLVSGRACLAFGSRVIAGISAVGFAALAVLVFLSGQMHWLVSILFLFGAANGAMDISMNQQAVLLERTAQSRLMSRLHGCYSLGALIGAFATYLSARHGIAPASQNLLLLGVVLAASLFLFPTLIAEQKPVTSESNSRRFNLFNHGHLVCLGALSFLTMLSEGVIADWGTVFLVEHSGIPPFRAALGYAVFALLMMFARVAGDSITAWVGPRMLVTMSGVLTVLGMTLILLPIEFTLRVIGFGILGLGLANLVPVIFSSAALQTQMPPASAITFVSTCGYAGLLIGPALIGLGAELFGLQATLVVIPLIGVIFVLAQRLFS